MEKSPHLIPDTETTTETKQAIEVPSSEAHLTSESKEVYNPNSIGEILA
jgi:hypothetical protein